MNTKISDAVPAGYRWRHSAGEKWQYSDVPCGWEHEPMYTNPQPAALNEVSGNSGELGGEQEALDIDDVRELFEEWAKGRDLTPNTWGSTSYENVSVDNDWLVWVAAWKVLAATGKQQEAEPRLHNVKKVAEHFNMAVTAKEMAEAIAGAPNSLFSMESAHEAFAETGKQQGGEVPDGVWEALQRIIENSALHGPASNEDAILVARYRRDLLAARKPVGHQPVVPHREAVILIHQAYNAGRKNTGYTYQVDALDEAIIDAPTAQGINLGKFRDLIGFAVLNAIYLPESDPRRDFIRHANELLALIDSQRDAGAGVDRD